MIVLFIIILILIILIVLSVKHIHTYFNKIKDKVIDDVKNKEKIAKNIFTSSLYPNQIIFIRHGEKSDNDNINLNDKGKLHAQCWSKFFTNPPIGINKPDILYAMKQKDLSSSNRPFQTIEPLSKILNLPVNTNYGKKTKDVKDLAKNILEQNDKNVLVSFEHDTIPIIVNELFPKCNVNGWNSNPYKKNKGDEFDIVWVIDFVNNSPELKVYQGCSIDNNNNCIILPNQIPINTIKC